MESPVAPEPRTDRILCFMAGAEAEHEILGHCLGVGSGDREEIDLMCAERSFSDAAWAKAEPRMRRMTRAMVRRHRVAVERVARALYDAGSLSANQIDALIQRGSSNSQQIPVH